jgi:hypothetical protein
MDKFDSIQSRWTITILDYVWMFRLHWCRIVFGIVFEIRSITPILAQSVTIEPMRSAFGGGSADHRRLRSPRLARG